MVLFAGFVADMFGTDVEQGPSLPIEKRMELTSSLLGGTGEAGQARMLAALEALTSEESLADIVDLGNIAAIGYCFGGSSVMDLLRLAPEGLKGEKACLAGRLREWKLVLCSYLISLLGAQELSRTMVENWMLVN